MDNYETQMRARVAIRLAEIAADAARLPKDEAAIMVFAANSHAELHEALCVGDKPRAQAARRRLDALAFNLAGEDHGGSYGAERRIQEHLAPRPGVVPLWGLDGEFLAVVDGIKVRCVKLGAHLTLHAVDVHAPFLSETGLRSCVNGLTGAGDVKASAVEAIRKVLRETGRQVIAREHHEYVQASTPAWVVEALSQDDAAQLTYRDGLQMAFAF